MEVKLHCKKKLRQHLSIHSLGGLGKKLSASRPRRRRDLRTGHCVAHGCAHFVSAKSFKTEFELYRATSSQRRIYFKTQQTWKGKSKTKKQCTVMYHSTTGYAVMVIGQEMLFPLQLCIYIFRVGSIYRGVWRQGN